MKVFEGTCIVTRGDHRSVASLIGAFESKEAALSALLVPVIRDDDEERRFPNPQVSSVKVRELDAGFLSNMAKVANPPEKAKAEASDDVAQGQVANLVRAVRNYLDAMDSREVLNCASRPGISRPAECGIEKADIHVFAMLGALAAVVRRIDPQGLIRP